MRALAVVVLCALTFLVACGGGTTDDSAGDPSSGPTTTAQEGFFVESDSTELNAATQGSQDAFAVVGSAEQVKRCNAAGQRGYGPWRRCFHEGLDPLVTGLDSGSTKLQEMSKREFVPACQEELQAASTVLSTQQKAVVKMLKVIDGQPGAAQERLAQTYQDDVRTVNDTVSAAYGELTQACYSPTDLASINASASPTT